MSLEKPTNWETFNPSDPVLLAVEALKIRAANLDKMLADDSSGLNPDTYERLQRQITETLSKIIDDELSVINYETKPHGAF